MKIITSVVYDMLKILEDPTAHPAEISAAATTIVEAIAPDVLEKAVAYDNLHEVLSAARSLAHEIRLVDFSSQTNIIPCPFGVG